MTSSPLFPVERYVSRNTLDPCPTCGAEPGFCCVSDNDMCVWPVQPHLVAVEARVPNHCECEEFGQSAPVPCAPGTCPTVRARLAWGQRPRAHNEVSSGSAGTGAGHHPACVEEVAAMTLQTEVRAYIEARELLDEIENVYAETSTNGSVGGAAVTYPRVMKMRKEVAARFARLKELAK